MKIITLLTFLILFCSSTFAQQTKSKCNCCTPSYQQFDFWVGEWNVYDTTGALTGYNVIKKIQGGCGIQENWRDGNGGTGTSLNYYDKSDSTWNQLWVDDKGNQLKLKGKYENDRMTLKSELKKGKKVDWYYDQISWWTNKDGSVNQHWEIFDKEGKRIKVVFKGLYQLAR